MRELDDMSVSLDPTSEDDPLDLIARLAAGERSALAELYDRHHEHLRAFAQRFVGDADAAEDLVHDVFVALPKVIRRFQGRSTLRTFLTSVAINHCRHHVRAAARRRAAHARMSQDQNEPKDNGATDEREWREALFRALDTLPMEQRAVFVLSAVEERTASEISAIVGAPEATVRTRLLRARQKLASALEAEGWS